MENGESQLSVEELFRHTLENAELVPGEAAKMDLMRKLARLEFLHFNPSRFNIYYLGLIVGSLVIAGLLILSDSKPENKTPQLQLRDEQTSGSVESGSTVKMSDLETKTPQKITIPVNTSVSKQEIGKHFDNLAQEQQKVISPAEADNSISGDIVLKKEIQPVLQTKSSGSPALFVPSVVSGCAPLKVRFSNLAGTYSSYKWAFGDGGFSSQKEPVWIFDVEGDYKVVLTVSDEKGRVVSSSVPIRVHPQPRAQFEISPDKAVLPIDDIRFINYSTGAAAYKWEFGDGNYSSEPEPIHKYLKYGRYDVSLVAISENGCSDTLIVKNAFSGSEYYINMPNAFIPNNHGPSGGIYSVKTDQAAEIFHPSYSGVIGYQLRIFAKTGALLFESNDINTGWDGYFKGQLCNPGVYIWKIRGNFSNGEPFTKMGDVTLLKN